MVKSSRLILSVMRLAVWCVIFSVLVSVTNVYSQPTENNSGTSPLTQSIQQLASDLDSIMQEITTPGVAVAIVSRDSVLWIGTYGLADIATDEPVSEDTHFCIGSCTKSFVGLGFLKLMEEGKIDLNTTVKEIAPEIEIDNPWADTHPVRIIHLLEHTSGFDDSHPNWFYLDGPRLTLREALEKKAHLRKVRWPPGTRYCYSSAGFVLAGYILGKISGQPYEEYLKENLLEPIGMKTSTIGSSEEARHLLAVGYDRNLTPFPFWYDYDEPAGAMNSSIKEMALFVKFLLNRGSADSVRIIPDSLFDRIGRPRSTLAAKAGLMSGYSFGVGTSYRGGARWLTHGGAVPGFLAEYGASPDNGLGYVLLQNSFDISFYDDMFTRVRDLTTSLVDSIPPPPSYPVSKSLLESCCGYYVPRNPRLQIMAFTEVLTGGVTVSFENDTLFTRGFMEDKTPLIPVTENLFRRPEEFEATRIFTENEDGDMVFASRSAYYERTSAWKIYLYRFLFFGSLIIMMSSIIYALFWAPVHLYKKLTNLDTRSKYISMRLVPLLAVLSLIVGVWKMGDQTVLEFGLKTALNAIFYLSTLLFAALSTLSVYTTSRSFYKPVKTVARVYAVLLTAACFGMTLYLCYWDVIGLKLWSY